MKQNFFLNLILFLGIFSLSTAVWSEGKAAEDDSSPRILWVKPAGQKIVVSIEPYALLFRSFKREQDEVVVLLKQNQGAHELSLRPSHLKDIAEADLLVWGGESLEPFLASVAKKAKRQLAIDKIEALHFISNENDHSHGQHQNIDPHVWLGEENSIAIAEALAKAAYYPDEATRGYSAPLRVTRQMMEKTARKTQKNKTFIVFHDAYAYLEQDLAIQHDFVLQNSHNNKPGLKHWQSLQELLKQSKTQNKGLCIVGAPGYQQSSEGKRLLALIDQAKFDSKKVSILELDPLAHDQQYLNYLAYLKTSQKKLKTCIR